MRSKILLVQVGLVVGWLAVGIAYAGNQALSLDGVVDYVLVDKDIDITGTISIEAWIRLESFTGNNRNNCIVMKGGAGIPAYGINYALQVRGDNKVLQFVIRDGGGEVRSALSSDTLNLDEWIHVAATFNENNVNFYINGSADSGNPHSLDYAMITNDAPFYIGVFDSNGTLISYFDGLIDEVRIWNRIPTQEEIQTNMNSSLTGNENGLVLYFTFDELNNEEKIPDLSGNDNNGTLMGGAELVYFTPPKQRIFLDWDNAVSVDFFDRRVYTPMPGDVILTTEAGLRAGSEPMVSVSDDFQRNVLNELNNIFITSGIGPGSGIEIVDSRTATQQADDLIVHFAPIPIFFSRGGVAFDVYDVSSTTPNPDLTRVGTDQFNDRASGEVAIFFSDLPIFGHTAKTVAEGVAHEVGHGMGLKHINPFFDDNSLSNDDGIEVMDYEDPESGNIERFTNRVSIAITPPFDLSEFPSPQDWEAAWERDVNGNLVTHNPIYHLRRWVLEEQPVDDDQRLVDGTEPGTWDEKVGKPNQINITLNTIEISVPLFDLMAMVDLHTAALSEPESLLFPLFGFVDPNNLSDLDFLVHEDLPFRLSASSVSGGDLDILFGFGDASNPNPLFDNLSTGGLFGNTFQFSSDTNSFEKVGEFSVLVTPTSTTVIEAVIDIKPDDDNNSINCNNLNGVIPIVILTTPDFDATTVDHTTVRFGKTGTESTETHTDKKTIEPKRHEEDLDNDGDIDLVFHFRFGDTGLACDDMGATLTGETFDGQAIIGIDRINTVPPKASPMVPSLPAKSLLEQNYPNPYNPETWIPFRLAKDAHVVIKIYNASGNLIRTLNLGHKAAGIYSSRNQAAYWDGRNESRERVASGIYFYTIKAGEFTATRKMFLLK